MLLPALITVAMLDPSAPPLPYGPTPSRAQQKWHELEFYAFVHFTVNTFTDREWGQGDEKESVFNPTDFSAEQIAKTFADSGMKGLIVTAKHHDGFCLWPSRFTEHSVKNSPWKGGKGDAIRELSDACRRHGLKFGVYLSPWDRNHAEYGRPAYIEYYRNQMRELLTQYGPIFEFWCDGANGGDGYYGGARETRTIDRGTYYDWQNTWTLGRSLQKDLVYFSDVGPDIRWVGNESGFAGDPCWATYTPSPDTGNTASPGNTKYQEGVNGHRNGKYWLPAEVDVSIRPGWFYHTTEDSKVRSPENLLTIYFESVGRGASMLLNVPPDQRGRIHENDVVALAGLKSRLDAIFNRDLAKSATIKTSNIRGGNKKFGSQNLTDDKRSTYWSTDDAVHKAEIVLDWRGFQNFNVVSIREFLSLGQRVDRWYLDRWEGNNWIEFAKGESIGNRRLWRGPEQSTIRLRLRLEGPVCPAISEFGVFEDSMAKKN